MFGRRKGMVGTPSHIIELIFDLLDGEYMEEYMKNGKNLLIIFRKKNKNLTRKKYDDIM